MLPSSLCDFVFCERPNSARIELLLWIPPCDGGSRRGLNVPCRLVVAWMRIRMGDPRSQGLVIFHKLFLTSLEPLPLFSSTTKRNPVSSWTDPSLLVVSTPSMPTPNHQHNSPLLLHPRPYHLHFLDGFMSMGWLDGAFLGCPPPSLTCTMKTRFAARSGVFRAWWTRGWPVEHDLNLFFSSLPPTAPNSLDSPPRNPGIQFLPATTCQRPSRRRYFLLADICFLISSF